nr:repressor LexA [Gammaproteobacteria bacterium]
MNSLTARQTEVLEFIRDEIATRGMPPTVSE